MLSGAIRTRSSDVDIIKCFTIGSDHINKNKKVINEGQKYTRMYEMTAVKYKIAKINPDSFADQPFKTDKLIITFFPEVMNKLEDEGKIILERTIGGENPVLIYRFLDNNILITLGQVGCPACAGNLDLFNTMGITKVMFCGGGGVLDKNIEVGQILVVDGAIRDEGFSYHYIEPSRYIYTDSAITGKITQYLDNNQVSYIRGLTWTTDAIFRETPDKIAQRKKRRCKNCGNGASRLYCSFTIQRF